MNAREITLPQLSVNDDTIALVRWLRPDGTRVTAGEPVCSVETSKAASDLLAEADGYLRVLLAAGQHYPVGSVAAMVTATADEPIAAVSHPGRRGQESVARRSGGRRVTKKAEIVARSLNVDIASIPGTDTVTEDMIRQAAALGAPAAGGPAVRASVASLGERIMVLGGGRGASQALDIIALTPGRRAVGILDDNPSLVGSEVMGIPVLGPIQGGQGLAGRDDYDAAIITFGGSPRLRFTLFDALVKQGVSFANLVHPQAVVDPGAQLGQGNVLVSLVRVGPSASIGDNNFFSAFCNVEHHCRIGSHCTFGPAVFLSGSVRIGNRVLLGTGIQIEPHVTIGDDCVIASGLTITQHVPSGHTALATDRPTVHVTRGA